jgi:hypothetical protein
VGRRPALLPRRRRTRRPVPRNWRHDGGTRPRRHRPQYATDAPTAPDCLNRSLPWTTQRSPQHDHPRDGTSRTSHTSPKRPASTRTPPCGRSAPTAAQLTWDEHHRPQHLQGTCPVRAAVRPNTQASTAKTSSSAASHTTGPWTRHGNRSWGRSMNTTEAVIQALQYHQQAAHTAHRDPLLVRRTRRPVRLRPPRRPAGASSPSKTPRTQRERGECGLHPPLLRGACQAWRAGHG